MENLFKLNTNENFAGNDAEYAEIFLEPWCHLNSGNKGSDFRKRYVQVFNYWLKLDEVELELTLDFFQWFHTIYILLDDIEDASEQRRGNPAAYVLYGVARTILAIDFSTVNFYLTGKSNPFTEVLQEPYNAELLEMGIHNIGRNVIEGQAIEIFWRDNFTCPSEEDYLYMTYKKTGHCLLAISSFMQSLTKTKLNITKLTLIFGVYTQITDDYRGLTSNLMHESKSFCDDIREGKCTFPFVHAINSRPNDKRLLGILKMRTDDIDLKKKCIELLEEFGSMEYTRNKIIFFKNLVEQEIERLGLDDKKFKLLFELHNYDQ